ncbi:MAG: hypothetical protein ACOH2V_03885 [Candidatus Saccharimonadaceae bacterium]
MIYLFNPDNDLALANFSSNFTASASARKLKDDLAILPVWYAPDKALVIAEGELNNRYLELIKQKHTLNNSLISFSELSNFSESIIKPWGWNPTLRRHLIQKRMDEKSLPSISDLEQIRNYSGRINSVKLLTELKELNSAYCGDSFFYSNIDKLLNYVYTSKGDQVLKMPYSGSGKGIVWIKGAITDKQIDWCKRVINVQGGVVVEPVLNRVQDFAMEFEMTDNGIQFVGYSLFQSAPSGAYSGSSLISDAAIEDRLSTYIERSLLEQLRSVLTIKLSEYFPNYRGYLGVDMMICQTSDKVYQLQPCVEVNMRMNMGIVAHHIYERFVHPNSSGIYSINFFKHEGEALDYAQTMQSNHPLVIVNGRIVSGYLALTPVDKDTRYVANISVK